MSTETWHTLGDWLITANAIAAGLFVIGYGIWAPWYRTPAGRNLFSVMAVLGVNAAYFGYAVLRGKVPTNFYPVRALLFAALLAVLLQRLIIFVKAQFLSRRANRRIKEKAHVGKVREDVRDADRDVDHGGSGELPRVGV